MIEQNITTPAMTINFRPRRSVGTTWRQYTAQPRIYVYVNDFDVIEDLENRFRRPHKVYRRYAVEALETLGMTDPKFSWSQKAGCSCGCSPGFIVSEDNRVVNGTRYWDLWIDINSAPLVDETKPARSLASALL
jgi:hypothetical protein